VFDRKHVPRVADHFDLDAGHAPAGAVRGTRGQIDRAARAEEQQCRHCDAAQVVVGDAPGNGLLAHEGPQTRDRKIEKGLRRARTVDQSCQEAEDGLLGPGQGRQAVGHDPEHEAGFRSSECAHWIHGRDACDGIRRAHCLVERQPPAVGEPDDVDTIQIKRGEHLGEPCREVVADHAVDLWNIPVLRVHYRLTPRT
jgi:hypothetical protein